MAIDFSKKFEGLNVDAMNSKSNLFGKATSAVQQHAEMELGKIISFPNELLPDECKNMFDDYSENDMDELLDSVKKYGVLQPILLRSSKRNPGFYEILAGHHRFEAASKAGLQTIPYRLKDVDDDTAVSIFVETNLNQRKHLSWRTMAYAYRTDLDALSHQGMRTDLMDDEYGEAVDQLQSTTGKSKRTILRIVRLTKLYSPFFDLLEQKKVPLMAAYHITFLPESEQTEVYDFLQSNDEIALTIQTAEQLHKVYEAQKWSRFTVQSILKPTAEKVPRTNHNPSLPKPVSIKFSPETYQKYFPELKPKEIQKKVMEIVEQYFKEAAE